MRPGDLQADREQLERGRTPSSEPTDLACSGVRKLRRGSWKVRAWSRGATAMACREGGNRMRFLESKVRGV